MKSAIGEVVRTAEIIHYAAEEGLRLEGEVLEGGAFDAGSKKKLLLFVGRQSCPCYLTNLTTQ